MQSLAVGECNGDVEDGCLIEGNPLTTQAIAGGVGTERGGGRGGEGRGLTPPHTPTLGSPVGTHNADVNAKVVRYGPREAHRLQDTLEKENVTTSNCRSVHKRMYMLNPIPVHCDMARTSYSLRMSSRTSWELLVRVASLVPPLNFELIISTSCCVYVCVAHTTSSEGAPQTYLIDVNNPTCCSENYNDILLQKHVRNAPNRRVVLQERENNSSQEEQNDANFSSVTPSSKEL